MPRHHFAKRLAAFTFGLLGCLLAMEPTVAEESILAVVGPGQAPEARLDDGALAGLPQHRVTTSTPWTEGVKVFEGVLVRDLLAHLGRGEAAMARLSALNNYSIDVPVEDFYRYDVILARRMDGIALTRRDKGPLWVVYPRDEVEELRDERYDIRWVWQINRIELF